jgi:hypothetical protein
MQSQFLNALIAPMALVAGSVIGYAFGLMQVAATRRHERLQMQGKFTTGWSATPGSFRRVAYLLIALALVQLLLPMFFTAGGIAQWCVSAGVVGGYGWILYKQLRLRRAA